MNAASLKASLLALAATITTWCIWWAKLVIAIGLAYAASRMFSLGWLSLEGIRIPIPKVTAEPLQLAYLAGSIWLISREHLAPSPSVPVSVSHPLATGD